MKLNQVVVASLVEEDMDNVIVEMNTLIHTIDLVEEDEVLFSEEEIALLLWEEEHIWEEERLWWRQS